MTSNLTALHEKFWEFRDDMEPYWKTPHETDAARFALTEAAEVLKTAGLWEAFVTFASSRVAQVAAGNALDAVLRRNISYSRNTPRNMDELSELGDLAIMILTTMGREPIQPQELFYADEMAAGMEEDFSIDRIVHTVSSMHVAAYSWQEKTWVRGFALMALRLIDRYPGMNLPAMIAERSQRIYRKHHPAAKEGGRLPDFELWQSETPAPYQTEEIAF